MLTSEATELALQGPTQVLDLITVIDGEEIPSHLWVLGLGAPLTPPPPELGTAPLLVPRTLVLLLG